MSNDGQPIFGRPEEWANFRQRQTLFLDRLSQLHDALDTAFVRKTTGLEHIDKFILMYGALCCADFDEILSCCENGYGAAAMRLLRSLYEKAVTLHYLHLNPAEFQDFWDYWHVTEHKLIREAEEAFGKGLFSESLVKEAERAYDAIKERFMITNCRKCGTKKLNIMWSKLPFPAIAKRAGDLGQLLVPAYVVPLRSVHATVAGLFDRIGKTDKLDIFLDPHANQHRMVDQALLAAHNIILDVLYVQNQRFKLPGLEEKIEICFQDFKDIIASKGMSKNS